MLADLIVIFLLALLLAAALVHMKREKKRGGTCMGCPNRAQCAGRNPGDCHKDGRE